MNNCKHINNSVAYRLCIFIGYYAKCVLPSLHELQGCSEEKAGVQLLAWLSNTFHFPKQESVSYDFSNCILFYFGS